MQKIPDLLGQSQLVYLCVSKNFVERVKSKRAKERQERRISEVLAFPANLVILSVILEPLRRDTLVPSYFPTYNDQPGNFRRSSFSRPTATGSLYTCN